MAGSEARTGLLPRLLPRCPLVTLACAVCLLPLLPAAASGGNSVSAPTASARPTVTGPPTQGSRVIASPGAWSGTGKLTLTYEWSRCDSMGSHCGVLRGVTTRGRLLGPNDVGHTLSLAVRATDSSGSAVAYASLVGPVGGTPAALAPTAQPIVSGDAVLGQTIRVDAGRWKPSPSAFSYQWARCNIEGRLCEPIHGATADTHEVDDGDLGHALVAIVQARSGSASRAVFSVGTSTAVASRGAVGPSSSAPPLVADVIQQGKQLTGVTGSWSGSGAIRYAFQWYRCDATGSHCRSIRGATGATYTQVAKDVGQTIGFGVRATDAVGATSAYASLVGPVAAADGTLVSAGQPTISGLPTQGQTLQVSTGGWTVPATSFGYQWQRCNANGRACVAIPGATGATYAATAADLGHALLAVVRATAGSATQDAFSVATRAIATAPGPANTTPPGVAGTIQQGKQLTGTPGVWSGSGTIAYAYQWYRCDAAGAHCKSIHGATAATYTQVAKDVGQTLGLAVRATDVTGTTTAFASLIGLVPGAGATFVTTAQPSIAAAARQGERLQVSNGAWNRTPTSFSYQWQRCNANRRVCSAIAGATASTYDVTASDAGFTLAALVQAIADGVPQATLSTTTSVVS